MWFRPRLLRLLQRIFGAENVRVITDEDRAMRALEKEAERRRRQNPNPRTLDEALEQLRDYCIPYFYREYPGVAIPTIDDADDEDGWERAYHSVPNPYALDDKKRDALQAYLARNRQLFASR